MTGLSSRARAGVAAIVALVLAASLSAPPASAAWQTTATAPAFALQTVTISAPTLVGCTPVTVNGARAARVTWNRVAGATQYTIIATNPLIGDPPQLQTVSDAGLTGPTFSATLQGGLLNGVIALLSGNPRIAAVASFGTWTSGPSASQTVLPGSGLGFLLGGATCP